MFVAHLGRHDPWEGGVRSTAFITGGIVPAALRGTSSGAKLIHISDWYPTFCNLAGVDPTDTVMFKGKMRPIEYEEFGRDCIAACFCCFSILLFWHVV
jgi:arylsulfatase A-like enzyme